MLAMKSYEQNEGFSVMTADEMYFVNGGSGNSSGIGGGIAETAIGVGIMAAGMVAAAAAPATAGISALGAAEAFCAGATLTAYGIGRLTGAHSGSVGSDVVSAAEPAETGLAGLHR
jgi:hypothetical protein